jgi:hypothetical protein
MACLYKTMAKIRPGTNRTIGTIMTYDELYDHITRYIASPHTAITQHDKRRACLILDVFMEFILDCDDDGIEISEIDLTDFIAEQLDILEGENA